MTQEELKAAMEEVVSKMPKGVTKDEMDAAVAKALEGLKPEVTKEQYDELKNALEIQGKKLSEKQVEQTEKNVGVAKAILDMFEEKGLKSLSDLQKVKGETIELKADNPLIAANYTGDYYRTKPVAGIRFPNERKKAFLGRGIATGIVEEGKNLLLWSNGAFTDHVAYIGELEDATTAVDGSKIVASDKTRELSGIVARAIISGRSFEDLPQLAQRIEQRLLGRIDLWLDQKIWDGAGNDATKKYEIYGVKTGQVTPFNAALVPEVKAANVGDLADACRLQASLSYANVNTVWMSEKLAFKLQRTKDTTGNYIINKLVDGSMMMAGLNVITTELFGGATEQMLVGDINAIQFWIKRNLTAEFERIAKSDSWNLYVYARQQVLVEDEDIKSLIYVSNVPAALVAIDPDLV